MQEKQVYSLVWFRNDLRVKDNESLHKAVVLGNPIVALYCFDERQFKKDVYGFKKTNKFRAKFLLETVADLKEQLKGYNIPLLVSFGCTEKIVAGLFEKYEISTVFYQNQWTSEEQYIEQQVQKINPNLVFVKVDSQFLLSPKDVFSVFNSIPNSFTSFRKKVERYVTVRQEFLPDLSGINSSVNINLKEEKQVTLAVLGFSGFDQDNRSAFPFKGGETSALLRLEDYFFETKSVSFYKKTRNGLLGLNYSTKFSPWLANGALSAVTIYHQIKKYEQNFGANDSTYWVIFELLWRDFFKYIALKYQNSIFFKGGIQFKSKDYKVNDFAVKQWIDGKTSCDFVNANMLELKYTGWMSNRGRQNVASYFAKHLCLDWRIGAAYFESMLIDYDVHSNYGNWMYVSGVGNDGRDREFNTQLQAQKYDGQFKYRNYWLQTQLF